jgi:Zn-dependent protease
MKWLWQVAKWRGVPINVHATILLAIPFLAMFSHSFTYALLAFPAFVFLMLVHELGHAWVVQRVGTRALGIELHAMHGLCRYERPYYETDEFLIAWGGVAAQAVVLVVAWPLGWLLRFLPWPVAELLRPTFTMLVWSNLLIIFLNLLPVPGLDGAKAWRMVPVWFRWLMERAPKLRWPRRNPGGRLRVVQPMVSVVEPDLQQQMRALPGEAESPEASAAAAELLDRLKRR